MHQQNLSMQKLKLFVQLKRGVRDLSFFLFMLQKFMLNLLLHLKYQLIPDPCYVINFVTNK
jgi:hypothetical protein